MTCFMLLEKQISVYAQLNYLWAKSKQILFYPHDQ